MKLKHIISAALCLLSLGTPSQAKEAKTLKETVGKSFLIGTAMNVSQIRGRKPAETKIITTQFNSIVAEDCMKSENLQPKQGKFKWADADKFVEFGEKNNMAIIGHCLVWHSQAPDWLFTDEKGGTVSRDTLVERMKQHISAVVGRYKGRIKGWDVVNEAFNDDGTYRQSPFYKIIGPEYLELAFRFAHAADPGAELYYNDYSMAKPKKREAVCRLVEDLRKKGCIIDAVGMQSHCGLDYPNLAEYEKTIVALKQCGVKVMITELDINVLPNPEGFGGAEISQKFKLKEELNPYKKGLTKEANAKFEQRYLDLFNIYRRHSKEITRVTLWGLTDKDTWLNNFPVKGRTNYPLLFDRNNNPKPIINKITDLFK